MRTVAEGVETPQQLAALTAMGVDEFQGYHFARPMPLDDWLSLLRQSQGQPPQLPLPVESPGGHDGGQSDHAA
jgi:sensor c-di-GMP phosphodiesterase-like protein